MYFRERKIFRSREDLLWFERCVRLEDRVEAARLVAVVVAVVRLPLPQ